MSILFIFMVLYAIFVVISVISLVIPVISVISVNRHTGAQPGSTRNFGDVTDIFPMKMTSFD